MGTKNQLSQLRRILKTDPKNKNVIINKKTGDRYNLKTGKTTKANRPR